MEMIFLSIVGFVVVVCYLLPSLLNIYGREHRRRRWFEPFDPAKKQVDFWDSALGHLHKVSGNASDIDIAIEYRFPAGRKYSCKIRMHGVYVGRGSLLYVKAYCPMQMGERTFRADRIVKFVDSDGTDIPPRQFLQKMGVTLQQQAVRYRHRTGA
jgi:hypothetical protein